MVLKTCESGRKGLVVGGQKRERFEKLSINGNSLEILTHMHF